MIAIIDYGLSNLLSIKRAVELYADCIVTNKSEDIEKADKIILPGVGAFQYGMDRLNALNLKDVIITEANNGKALLGICLGMQMLFDNSEEGGLFEGLGLIPGSVKKISMYDLENNKQAVPHIGWEKLYVENKNENWHNSLEDISEDSEMYFVHSYEAFPKNIENYFAYAIYGGRKVCAIAQKNNIIGCQFHPEKSGKEGLKIIKNFVQRF